MSVEKLLTVKNNVTYNLHLAKNIGVKESIMISVLLDIRSERVLNGRMKKDEFFRYTISEVNERTAVGSNVVSRLINKLEESGILETKETRTTKSVKLKISEIESLLKADALVTKEDQLLLLQIEQETEDLVGKLYKPFMDAYWNWFVNRSTVKPVIDNKQGKALKKLIAYMVDVTIEGSSPLEAFETILEKWDSLPNFYKQKTTLLNIWSNIDQIVTEIKLKHNRKSRKGNKYADAAKKIIEQGG